MCMINVSRSLSVPYSVRCMFAQGRVCHVRSLPLLLCGYRHTEQMEGSPCLFTPELFAYFLGICHNPLVKNHLALLYF